MSRMARNKGASGEREILKWFMTNFDLTGLKRNFEQAGYGGADCLDIPYIALEVKRQESVCVNLWWKQTIQQAQAAQRMPVLAYRQNRKKWLFCIPASLITPTSWGYLTLTDTEFILWFENYMLNK